MSFSGVPNRFHGLKRSPSRPVKILCVILNIASVSLIGYILAQWLRGG